MRKFFYFIGFLLISGLVETSTAYAYLDPASGSILIYALFGMSVALVYALRGIGYKFIYSLLGRSIKTTSDIDGVEIVFYSEGNRYWSVFEPIIKALHQKRVKILYVTPDIKEKEVQYKYDNVIVKSFSSELKAIVFMNNLTANIVVSTTPQLNVYMLKRSKKVKHYMHVFHAPTDAALYEKHAFDYYDSVLCSGPHQIESIKILENMRGSKTKELYEIGCTYYDIMVEETGNIKAPPKSTLTVLYASSWGRNSSLVKYGVNILKPLLNDKFTLIVRPHPQMFTSHEELMEEIIYNLNKYDNVSIDREPFGHKSMAASDIMVTDISGIIFDYAFLFRKPIIVIDSQVDYGGFEAEDLEEIWEIKTMYKMCRVIKENEISKLSNIVFSELDNKEKSQRNILKIRDQFVYNFGHAGMVAANKIVDINRRISEV